MILDNTFDNNNTPKTQLFSWIAFVFGILTLLSVIWLFCLIPLSIRFSHIDILPPPFLYMCGIPFVSIFGSFMSLVSFIKRENPTWKKWIACLLTVTPTTYILYLVFKTILTGYLYL